MKKDRLGQNSGVTLIELIIVIAIMAVLVGVLSPMFVKYVDRSKKAKDVYTADQIARAANIAFIENPEAYEAFKKWTGAPCDVTVTVNGVTEPPYKVYRVASNGKQGTNGDSNCFNGGMDKLYKNPDGSNDRGRGATGFYGVLNRELGLSTTEMNSEIIPKFTRPREGTGVKRSNGLMEPYAELDRWRIVRRADNGMMEIWSAQPNPEGGYPIYRVWPEPDDIYRQ